MVGNAQVGNQPPDQTPRDLDPLYTERSCEVLERLADWIEAEEARTQTNVAAALGVHQSTLGRLISHTYDGRVGDLVDRIESWLDLQEARAAAPDPPAYVPTAIGDRVMRVLQLTHVEGGMGAVLGPTGVGKTMAARRFVEGTPGTVYLYAGPCASKAALVYELADLLGIATGRSVYAAVQAICDHLAERDRLIIVDEADYLGEDVLHTLRQISDVSHAGLVLIGTEGFLQRLRRRRSTTINQVLGRIRHVERLGQIGEDDLGRILAGYDLSDEAAHALIAGAHGQARRAVAALTAASRIGDGELTQKRIRQAYKSLMPVMIGLPD